jgi:hypothetical protein
MSSSTGRLRLAPDEQSDARLERPDKLKGPAATRSGSPGFCRTRTRGLPTPTRCEPSEGVDMTKRTRGPDPVDRRTRTSGVNITPPTQNAGPVTSIYSAR